MSNIISELAEYNNALIVGPLPPPIGGVSTFLERLTKHSPIKIFDTSNFGILRYLILAKVLIFGRYDVVFLNIITIKYILCIRLVYWGDVMIMDHNNRLFDRNKFAVSIIRRCLRGVRTVHVVSETIKHRYLLNDFTCKGEIKVTNSFIPPVLEDREQLMAQYPQSLMKFIDSKRLILVSGYSVKFHDVSCHDLTGC